MTRSALDQFRKGETKNLSPESCEAWETFLFRSPLGRALCKPSFKLSGHDHLIEILSSGAQSKPKEIAVEGRYFLYHGSYLRPSHFAVHLLEIYSLEDNVLGATLTLKDNITAEQTVHKAFGCVVFSERLPQIIFEPADSRLGLSLIAAIKMPLKQNSLDSFVGAFLGTNEHKQSFHRLGLVRRATEDPPGNVAALNHRTRPGFDEEKHALMIEETGVFRLDELTDRHREAIEHLARVAPEQLFDDPIFEHPRWRTRGSG